MASSSLLSVFLLLPLCLSISIIPCPAAAQDETSGQEETSGGEAGNNLIQETCSKTMFPGICQETASAFTQGSTVSITDMVRVSLNLASMAANETSFYTSGMLQIAQRPVFKQCISQCSETYMDAGIQLGNAMLALESKNYQQLFNWVSVAMKDSAICMDGCKGVMGLMTRLVAKNDYFNKLCTNTLAIAKLLQQ